MRDGIFWNQSTMIRSCLLGVVATIALTSATFGQGRTQMWSNFLPNLSKEDKALAEQAAREELTGKPVGTVLTWQNSKSGNSGTVQLVSNYNWESYSCRKVVHVFNLAKEKGQRWEVNLCLVDGKWKWPVPPKKL